MAFVAEAKIALAHGQLAVQAAKVAREPDKLALGYSPNVNPILISRVRQSFVRDCPTFGLHLSSGFTLDQLVRSGEMAAGLVVTPAECDGLSVERVSVESLIVGGIGAYRQPDAFSAIAPFDVVAPFGMAFFFAVDDDPVRLNSAIG